MIEQLILFCLQDALFLLGYLQRGNAFPKPLTREEEMKLIAHWIKDVIADFEGNKERITAEVEALCKKYPIY